MYIVAVFIGSGGAGMLITSLSITAELIGKNKESSAFVYGATSLVDKISNGEYFFLWEIQISNGRITPFLQLCICLRFFQYVHIIFRLNSHAYSTVCAQNHRRRQA